MPVHQSVIKVNKIWRIFLASALPELHCACACNGHKSSWTQLLPALCLLKQNSPILFVLLSGNGNRFNRRRPDKQAKNTLVAVPTIPMKQLSKGGGKTVHLVFKYLSRSLL
jgi:hypothetical protein